MADLTGSRKRSLRSIGRHVKPTLTLGRAGITDPAVQAVRDQLRDGGLIKVRLSQAGAAGRRAQAEQLALRADALCIDLVGRSALLYRAGPEAPSQGQ
jgi:RNA-binding protein